MSDRVRANTLFFFFWLVMPFCHSVWCEIHRSKFYRWRHDNYQQDSAVGDISRRFRHSLYVNRFISVSSYFLPFPQNAIRGPAIHVFLVTEYDSNPFRRNKSTSRLRRSLGRCATSLRSLLTTYESSTCSKSTKKCKLCITHLQRTSQYHARFCKPSSNLQRLLL